MTTAPTKKKHPRSEAIAVAKELVALLKPVCEPDRLVVAGSLRRGRPSVSDIELLFVPSWGAPEQLPNGDLFIRTEPVDKAHEAIEQMLRRGVISKRLAITGKVSSYGPLNKHCVHQASGIPVDLFSEPFPRCWFRSLVIRTGSLEMNLLLTKTAISRGRTLHAYGDKCVEVRATGEALYATSEEELFSMCGVKFRLPMNR